MGEYIGASSSGRKGLLPVHVLTLLLFQRESCLQPLFNTLRPPFGSGHAVNTMQCSNIGFSLMMLSLAPKEDVSGQCVLYHTADESWGQGWLSC